MDVELFKSLLQDRKSALIRMINKGKKATEIVELDQSSVGRLSRMDAMQGQAMAIATMQRKQNELQKIEAALKRINQKEYGHCLECDEQIPEARLTLDPSALHCINCAGKKEISRNNQQAG